MDPIQNQTVQQNDLDKAYRPLPVNIVSPINVSFLNFCLLDHPDQDFVTFLIHGFTHGFDIGYRGNITPGQQRNLLSARNNPTAVSAAIRKELDRGHTSGPFASPPFRVLHCSPLGAVPKKDGSHRIILDLSSPRGSAINEGIPEELFTVHYSSFDDAVKMVHSLGQGAFMAKLDIKHAFRLCPVRAEDWVHLGYYWLNKFYIDTRLPFGSRSSPFIFNQFADALLWILMTIFGIPFIIHYLDDFLICNVNHTSCKDNMDVMQSAFSKLGVPLAPEKVIGPAQVITYLGIEIDSIHQCIRLPSEKLNEIHELLRLWADKKKCTKRELLSLIGLLSFASKVVKPGRMFLRRLIDLSTSVASLNHHISLNSEARADIHWWRQFLSSWNGVEMIQTNIVTSHTLRLATDASFKGMGAVYQNQWISAGWPSQSVEHHINFLELFAIVAAVFTWGSEWTNQQILIYTDNQAITYIWKSGTCRDKNIMRLIRALFTYTAKANINILFQHISGHSNYLADCLSRLQVNQFRKAHQHASIQQSHPPDSIWELY